LFPRCKIIVCKIGMDQMPLARVEKAITMYPDLKIILFEASTHTSELAAQALGVKAGQIAKSLVERDVWWSS